MERVKREFSREHIENLRKSHLGNRLSEDSKRKISESLKGRTTSPSTLFKKGHKLFISDEQLRINQSKGWSRVVSDLEREKRREIALKMNSARFLPKRFGNKDSLGRKHPTEVRIRMSETHKKRVAEGKHNNYKGGTTKESEKIRKSLRYRFWREAVFRRDNWTCVECHAKGSKGKPVILNADHIKSFAYFPELRFDLSNGRTLCLECHKKTPTYLRDIKPNNKELVCCPL